MTRKKSAIIFTLIFTLVSFAQQRSEWKGEYLQELNATQSEIEFHLKNDQIIDFNDFFWDPNTALPPIEI